MDEFEAMELLYLATGLTTEQFEVDYGTHGLGICDDLCNDAFDVDFENFVKIAEALMPFSHLSESPLSEGALVGFGDHKTGWYITKKRIENGTSKN